MQSGRSATRTTTARISSSATSSTPYNCIFGKWLASAGSIGRYSTTTLCSPVCVERLSADLAIRSGSGEVLLAAEFKYEPAHRRLDLLLHKFPVIGWGDALKDISRIREFVTAGKVPVAYAVLVDEGRYF